MPRKKKLIPSKPKTIQIPEDVYNRVELLLMNPSRGKAEFGAWSDLITSLLREWVMKQIKEHQDDSQRQVESSSSGDSRIPRGPWEYVTGQQPPQGIHPIQTGTPNEGDPTET